MLQQKCNFFESNIVYNTNIIIGAIILHIIHDFGNAFFCGDIIRKIDWTVLLGKTHSLPYK
jgi:hypothetical protein